jgi:hypothetical protein
MPQLKGMCHFSLHDVTQGAATQQKSEAYIYSVSFSDDVSSAQRPIRKDKRGSDCVMNAVVEQNTDYGSWLKL